MKRLAACLIVLCLLPSVLWAANDFGSDSAIQALYRCDSSPGITQDSKLTNHLTESGDGVGTSYTAKQGSHSCDFKSGLSGYLDRADTDLTANFPGKNAGGKTLSVSVFFRPESVPTFGRRMYLVSKWDRDNEQRSYLLDIFHNKRRPVIEMLIGYQAGGGAGDGDSYEATTVSQAEAEIVAGNWYHATMTFNNSTGAYALRLRGEACAVLGTDSTGTFSKVRRNGGMADSAVDFAIGASGIGLFVFDGLIDEVVVSNDVFTSTESDQICNGTYPSGVVGAPPKQ
jgi:Concanavalin A-like lectin/glucanases superfamily